MVQERLESLLSMSIERKILLKCDKECLINLYAGLSPELCIDETRLNQTFGDHEVCLPGFDIVRRDQSVNGRHGGEVCNYIQSGLNYKECNNLQSHILENLIVKIIKPHSKSILVSTW